MSESSKIPHSLAMLQMPSGKRARGRKENVVEGIKAHNKIIKTCFDENIQLESIFFIDMNNYLTCNVNNFYDICHLSSNGSTKFVSILFPIFKSIVEKNDICTT